MTGSSEPTESSASPTPRSEDDDTRQPSSWFGATRWAEDDLVFMLMVEMLKKPLTDRPAPAASTATRLIRLSD